MVEKAREDYAAKLGPILEELVTDLLKTMPDQPRDFMLEWMTKKEKALLGGSCSSSAPAPALAFAPPPRVSGGAAAPAVEAAAPAPAAEVGVTNIAANGSVTAGDASAQKPVRGIRVEGREGLATILNDLKQQHGDAPSSVWLVFDWDKTLKLPFPKEVEAELPSAPQWTRDLAKDLRGGPSTLLALERSPFQKFIVTAKPPALGNPATGLLTEAGATLRDPIFLRMHKCFSLANHGGDLIRYTTPDGATIEYTDEETLKAESWEKVPRHELMPADFVKKFSGEFFNLAQNHKDEEGKWKFHSDVESMNFAAIPTLHHGDQDKSENGGTHFFPNDEDHNGTVLKRVGNVYSSGYEKHVAIAKAIQLAKIKGQALPTRICFFDDNVNNAFMVNEFTALKIKEVLPDADIQVEGIFWDPYQEEHDGDAGLSPPPISSHDHQLDGVIQYPNFKDDHHGAVAKGINKTTLEHLEFYGLGVEELVKRFEWYLPQWEQDANDKGIKLGELQGEAALSEEELKAREEARRQEVAEEQRKRAEEMGVDLDGLAAEEIPQSEALAALDHGPKKTGIAKIPDFQLGKAKEKRLKKKEELSKFVEGGLTYAELSEETQKDFAEEGGEAGAKEQLETLDAELDEIEKRLNPKGKGKGGKGKDGEGGKGKGKDAKGKGKANADALPAPAGKAKGKGKGKGGKPDGETVEAET